MHVIPAIFDQMKPRGTKRKTQNPGIAKRSPNACSRCRKQKIKCSGSQPCERCSKRNLTCVFDERDQKILVTRGYIWDLQQKIQAFESRRNPDATRTIGDADQDANRTIEDADRDATLLLDEEAELASSPLTQTPATNPDIQTDADMGPSGLTNPLSVGPSSFMSSLSGRTYYLGTSSNWSFSRRILSMAYEKVYQAPLPTGALLFDGGAYNLELDESGSSLNAHPPVMPTLDYALYLINTVNFRCGQLFHLYDPDSFMPHLHAYYSDHLDRSDAYSLWYIHFILILALGKALVMPGTRGKLPNGIEFFLRAIQLLPDVKVLCHEPMESTELLCCIALFYQSLDFRHSAYNYIGQAMRMALGEGMHTDMPVQDLGEAAMERRRKAWWTVYILDRQMTSLMGLPQSISDDHICPQLPKFPGSPQRTVTLDIHIKLSRVIAEINGTIYGIDGRLNKRFLLSTKFALEKIAGMADELRDIVPLPIDKALSGVSRLAAYLHLLYHQCIILATRPLLFFFLNIRFESLHMCIETLNGSSNVRDLLQICVESSKQIVNILKGVQAQGLLESFLSFDLESTFVSGVVFLVSPVIDPSLVSDHLLWLEKLHGILDEMTTRGNLIAEFRKSELQQLEDILSRLPAHKARSPPLADVAGFHQPNTHQQEQNSTAPKGHMGSEMQTGPLMDQGVFMDVATIQEVPTLPDILSTAQLMALVDSIEAGDEEWILNAW